jgi:hypothetical protein
VIEQAFAGRRQFHAAAAALLGSVTERGFGPLIRSLAEASASARALSLR